MTVLVDTSVWIRFLSNRAPSAGGLQELLTGDEVCGHDFVYGELLIGDVGGGRQLLDAYEQMHQAPVVPDAEVVAFVRGRRLHGRGIGWIDAHLLASVRVARLKLWPVDPRVVALAKSLASRTSKASRRRRWSAPVRSPLSM
jgi:predicted nucleic acid-binding protein